jgi:hypothetical protein
MYGIYCVKARGRKATQGWVRQMPCILSARDIAINFIYPAGTATMDKYRAPEKQSKRYAHLSRIWDLQSQLSSVDRTSDRFVTEGCGQIDIHNVSASSGDNHRYRFQKRARAVAYPRSKGTYFRFFELPATQLAIGMMSYGHHGAAIVAMVVVGWCQCGMHCVISRDRRLILNSMNHFMTTIQQAPGYLLATFSMLHAEEVGGPGMRSHVSGLARRERVERT